MSIPSYSERHEAVIQDSVLEDLSRPEYKTISLTYIAKANNANSESLALVYAQIATAYASLEQARWLGKAPRK